MSLYTGRSIIGGTVSEGRQRQPKAGEGSRRQPKDAEGRRRQPKAAKGSHSLNGGKSSVRVSIRPADRRIPAHAAMAYSMCVTNYFRNIFAVITYIFKVLDV